MRRGNGNARLDADKILTAALAIADRHGLSGMTLRMVGAELGADPTSIYRHFASKEALVAAMADRLFGEVAAADYPEDWRERFIAIGRAARHVYRSHPTIVDVLANQPEESPSLIAINELSIGCLVEAGLDPVQVGLFHQLLSSYVIGTGVLEASWDGFGDGARDASRRAYSALHPREYPNCVAFAWAMFPEADDVFEFAMGILLDAVTGLTAQAARAKKSAATASTTTTRKKA
ncbi:MAG TPA: TetR/AcrR family transcriptional regulator [Ilumatobacteraceae bacterium]